MYPDIVPVLKSAEFSVFSSSIFLSFPIHTNKKRLPYKRQSHHSTIKLAKLATLSYQLKDPFISFFKFFKKLCKGKRVFHDTY